MVAWGQVQLHLTTCPEKDQSKVNFGCPYCMFVFHKRNIRNLHMLSHCDKGLKCVLCPPEREAQWDDWKTLRKHYQSRHSKALTGRIGPFRHMLPTRKVPPKCHMCQTEFKQTDLYNIHMIKAHDLVPYVLIGCEKCDKTFRTQKRYEWHLKHYHDEDVECDQCDFVARNKTVLK